jgi:glycerol-3-phosphate O-acyltransferase/dihydroxyacetone phosphate acyltransferase
MSAGFPVGGFTTLDSKEGFDQANRKIRAAMRERGELRRRQSEKRRMSLADGDGLSSDEEGESVESVSGSALLGDYEEARKAK